MQAFLWRQLLLKFNRKNKHVRIANNTVEILEASPRYTIIKIVIMVQEYRLVQKNRKSRNKFNGNLTYDKGGISKHKGKIVLFKENMLGHYKFTQYSFKKTSNESEIQT